MQHASTKDEAHMVGVVTVADSNSQQRQIRESLWTPQIGNSGGKKISCSISALAKRKLKSGKSVGAANRNNYIGILADYIHRPVRNIS